MRRAIHRDRSRSSRDRFTGDMAHGRIHGMQAPELAAGDSLAWREVSRVPEAPRSEIGRCLGKLIPFTTEWAAQAATAELPAPQEDAEEIAAGQVELTTEHGYTALRYYQLTGDLEAYTMYRAIFRLIDSHNNDEPLPRPLERRQWMVTASDALRAQQSSAPEMSE